MSNYKSCGKILATHGLKGAVKIQNYSDFNRFFEGNIVYYQEGNEYLPLKIKMVANYKQGILVVFDGYEDINLIEPLVGNILYAIASNDDLEEDEYFYSDLLNKDLYNTKGQKRGKVIDVKEYPQGHMLIAIVEEKRRMIPFRKEFVKEVLSDKIIIEEIEGLL